MIFSANTNWYYDHDPKSFVEAAKCGFKAAELLEWYGYDLNEYKKILEDNDIVSTCLLVQSKKSENMDKIAWTHGLGYPDAEEAMVEAFKETVETAKFLNVPNIVVTTGNVRRDVSRDFMHKQVVQVLNRLASIAEDAGVTVVLEPLNVLVDHMGHFLTTSKEAFQMVKEVNNPYVKVLFDIYHQQITEGNVIRNITENIDLIGHFHIADNPDRNEPGTGEINYINVFKAIKKTGYDRYLAFECGRTVDIPTLMENMKPYIAIAD